MEREIDFILFLLIILLLKALPLLIMLESSHRVSLNAVVKILIARAAVTVMLSIKEGRIPILL